jgi:hypothetical protein
MASDGFAYIVANVGANEPSRATTLTTVSLNVGVELKPLRDAFAVANLNVGIERTLQPTSFAAVNINVVGSTGLTRWHGGVREALTVKGMQQTGSLVPLTVRGRWNAIAQTVDPLA